MFWVPVRVLVCVFGSVGWCFVVRFDVVKRDVCACRAAAGKRISKEEDNNRLMPSSTLRADGYVGVVVCPLVSTAC